MVNAAPWAMEPPGRVVGIWLARLTTPFCPIPGWARLNGEQHRRAEKVDARPTPGGRGSEKVGGTRHFLRLSRYDRRSHECWVTLANSPGRSCGRGRGRSALVVIALALSICGISGVRGAVSVALDALHQGSRASLAGDLSIDTGDAISEKQYAALVTRCARMELSGRWSLSS